MQSRRQFSSTIKLIRNLEFHSKTKYIDVKYYFIREKFENGKVVPSYVSTKEQEADILAKPLRRTQTEELRGRLEIKTVTEVSVKYLKRWSFRINVC